MPSITIDNIEYSLPPVVYDILMATTDERDEMKAKLSAAKQALEHAKPILRYHIHEPWRNEMDKQTEYAFNAVAHTLYRLNH